MPANLPARGNLEGKIAGCIQRQPFVAKVLTKVNKLLTKETIMLYFQVEINSEDRER